MLSHLYKNAKEAFKQASINTYHDDRDNVFFIAESETEQQVLL